MGHGLCRDLLDRAMIGHSVLLGAPVLGELRRVLTVKFRVPEVLWQELETKLSELERTHAATVPLDVVISDPTDVPVLACALASGADVFVTGDKALLELGTIGNIPILSPRHLWEQLSRLGNKPK